MNLEKYGCKKNHIIKMNQTETKIKKIEFTKNNPLNISDEDKEKQIIFQKQLLKEKILS